MVQPSLKRKQARLWRVAALLVFVLLALVFLAHHRDSLRQSLDAAQSANLGWVGLGFGLTCVTFLFAAAIYSSLALHPLRLRQTLLVELAAAFANRLLPAGLGGLGLHGVYLYKRQHTVAETLAVVSVNNLLGIATHLFLLALVVVYEPALLHRLHLPGIPAVPVVYILAAMLVLAAPFALPKVRRQLRKFVRNLLTSFRLLKPKRIAQACIYACLLTATFTAILFSVAQSVGIHLSILQIFIVFSMGMLAATATPTPGGLVGAEAGLVAGFVAYGIHAELAGAAVLLYRILTYWLPLVPGAVALVLARHRRLV